MTLTLLRFGVDTLECTFTGTLEERVAADLLAAKQHAQDTDAPVQVSVGDSVLAVLPKGHGFYPFVLSDQRMLLRVSPRISGPPPCSARMRATALAVQDVHTLYSDVCDSAASLGFAFENTLSRIDLAADVQGWTPDDSQMRGLVCPATYRARHEDGAGLTYQYGKGDIVLRVYNKTAEIAANPKKRGYGVVWEGAPGYSPDLDVWRIEYQVRGSALAEYGCRHVSAALDRLPELFGALMLWGDLRVPASDTNRTRWARHPIYEQLDRLVMGESAPVPRVRSVSRLLSMEAAARRLPGLVATYAAQLGTTDYWDALKCMSTDAMVDMEQREVSFEELVDQKKVKLLSGEGVF